MNKRLNISLMKSFACFLMRFLYMIQAHSIDYSVPENNFFTLSNQILVNRVFQNNVPVGYKLFHTINQFIFHISPFNGFNFSQLNISAGKWEKIACVFSLILKLICINYLILYDNFHKVMYTTYRIYKLELTYNPSFYYPIHNLIINY